MSRYRPPRPAASPYITPAGHRRLNQELKRLWKEDRPDATRKVAAAAALGDRSENADYIYGKRLLRSIDSRIEFLSKRLDALTVVDRPPADQDAVYFGAWVEVSDATGALATHRLVGPDEFDQDQRFVSIDAPLARALLKKQVGDAVSIEVAGSAREMTIEKIWYEPTG